MKKLHYIKLILIVILFAAVLAAIIFCIYTYRHISGGSVVPKPMPGLYVTPDGSMRLRLDGSGDNISLNIYPSPLHAEYTENILTLTDGYVTYTFAVIDGATLFGDATGYMYLIGE